MLETWGMADEQLGVDADAVAQLAVAWALEQEAFRAARRLASGPASAAVASVKRITRTISKETGDHR
jgi:hypothetical protein